MLYWGVNAVIHPFGRVMLTPSGTASKARDTELASEGAAVLETEREKKEREREYEIRGI